MKIKAWCDSEPALTVLLSKLGDFASGMETRAAVGLLNQGAILVAKPGGYPGARPADRAGNTKPPAKSPDPAQAYPVHGWPLLKCAHEAPG